MSRLFVLTCVVAGMISAATYADDPPAKEQPETKMEPDPRWVPKPGDKATVNEAGSPGGVSYFAFEEFQKFRSAKDQTGVQSMLDKKLVFPVPKGVGVLVLKRYQPERVFSTAPMSSEDYRAAVQSSILSGASRRVYPLEVRILDGERKDKVLFIAEDDIAKLIPVRVSPMIKLKEKPKPKPVDPTARVKSLLRSAQILEKDGKTKGAVDYYKTVVKDYPKSEEAKVATARLKAIKP